MTRETQLRRCSENKDTFNRLWQQHFLTCGYHDNGFTRNQDIKSGSVSPDSYSLNQENHAGVRVDRDNRKSGNYGGNHSGIHGNIFDDYSYKVHSVQDLETHTFPSISRCISWVSKKRWCHGQQRNNRYVASIYATEDYQKDWEVENSYNMVANRVHTLDRPDQRNGVSSDGSQHGNIGGEVCRNGESNLSVGEPGTKSDKRKVQVLITGSLHLVGGALRVLEDKCSNSD